MIHNLLFPNTAYKFVGFTLGKEGELRAVLQQRFIEGEQVELENIKEYWIDIGRYARRKCDCQG